MKKQIDCRKEKNKAIMQCRVKRFCNHKENNLLSAGKGIFALSNPNIGAVIGVYEIGKSIVKAGVCRK